MSKKRNKSSAVLPDRTTDLLARVHKAVRERRTQQALELCKALHKQEPTPAHFALLQECSLERARQLRENGYERDAIVVLENTLNACRGNVDLLTKVLSEMAAAECHPRLWELVEQLPDPTQRATIIAKSADAAVKRGAAARDKLPEALQPQLDAVLLAFTNVAAGQDDAARDAVQQIGLQSPFLEWKLLLRGLMAYYQNDDPRALENWQRLQSDRLPARLAAPFRYRIDEAYRTSQSPEAQAMLLNDATRLQDPSLTESLRLIQKALATPRTLHDAFRIAGNLIPTLRRQNPSLVLRLANCFYWAVAASGSTNFVQRFAQILGASSDDPHLHRLRALTCERHHDLADACIAWQQYERQIPDIVKQWPRSAALPLSDLQNQARAMVLGHIGKLAAELSFPDQLDFLPDFMRDQLSPKRAAHPNAEDCFVQRLALVPDQLEAYTDLLEYYRQLEEPEKAENVARRLVERFPNHAETLEFLGDCRMTEQDYEAARSYFERALLADSLQPRLRKRVADAQRLQAQLLASQCKWEQSTQRFEAAVACAEPDTIGFVRAEWAACEHMAGRVDRAEELFRQAQVELGSVAGATYARLVAALRCGAPRSHTRRLDQELVEAMRGKPTNFHDILRLTELAVWHCAADIEYHGQKTHVKKIIAFIRRVPHNLLNSKQLTRIAAGLIRLGAFKPGRDFALMARKQDANEPLSYFLEAESFIAQGPENCPIGLVQNRLETAQQLAHRQPANPERQKLLDEINQRRQLIESSNALASSFGEFFGQFDDAEDDDAFDDSFQPFGPRRRRRR